MKNVYTVEQINKYIKNMFAQDFMLHQISIKGEVSNCKYHSSGHIYFSLKDTGGVMKAVMFKGSRANGLGFSMQDGDQVIVTGSVEVYERDGVYQIYARKIERDGEGNLYLKFEELKKELEEMGMFASEYKRPIPKYAKRIGIVTAETGAAIQDIRNISARRNPYVQLILCPTLVQGEGAKESIVNGIHALERLGVDTIIVGRGGGSIEDLWAFNEEIVARAVFDCSVPVISAVGHETDWTIVDFVADQRAPTPSAAAELAVFDYRIIMQELDSRQELLMRELKRKLEKAELRLGQFRLKLKLRSPLNRLNENRSRIADYEEKTELVMKQKLLAYRHKLKLLAQRLEGDSPVKKLGGGYAFVSINGKGLKHVSDTKTGDELQIYLPDGTIRAKVEETEPKTEES